MNSSNIQIRRYLDILSLGYIQEHQNINDSDRTSMKYPHYSDRIIILICAQTWEKYLSADDHTEARWLSS